MILNYAHHKTTSYSLEIQLKSEGPVEYFSISKGEKIECCLEVNGHGYHFTNGIDKIYIDEFAISFSLTPLTQNYLKEDYISIINNLSNDQLLKLKNDLQQLFPFPIE